MDDAPIQSYLAPEEVLLWSGTPARKLRLGTQHIPLLFTLVIFGAFLLIPIMGLLGSGQKEKTSSTTAPELQADSGNHTPAPPQHEPTKAQRVVMTLFFLLFAGSFVGFILYSTLRQLGGPSLTSRSTLYAVTDQRIVIVTGKSKKVVTSLMLSTLAQVQMQQWSDGLGTIMFGPRPVWPSNTGFYAATPSLENILDSTKVFQLIAKNRTER